jgi:cobalt-zinc-cadmium efflux system outer membrane protein
MRLVIILLMMSGALCSSGQPDTIRFTLQQADSIFLKENLLLLSRRYNLDANEAQIIQAKAYPNPILSATINAVDPEHDKYFNVGQDGQKEFDIQQLLILGGKRKTSIELAKQGRDVAAAEFTDLLRNLRLQLHTSFFHLHMQRTIIAAYDHQMSLLDQIISSYEQQAIKGNIPVKDVIRLKAIYLEIGNEKLNLRSQEAEAVRILQVLLQINSYPDPIINAVDFDNFRRLPSIDSILTLAMSNRPDLTIALKERDLSMSNLRLQKQLTIPDAILSAGYDQRGGAFHNQVNVGVAFPIPVFDRNRGNIKSAEYNRLSADLSVSQKQKQIEADVVSAWQNMKSAITEYNVASHFYSQDFTEVFEGINENFRRRNISILEFVDFFEAYNQSLANVQRIKTQLAVSAAQINYTTSTIVY